MATNLSVFTVQKTSHRSTSPPPPRVQFPAVPEHFFSFGFQAAGQRRRARMAVPAGPAPGPQPSVWDASSFLGHLQLDGFSPQHHGVLQQSHWQHTCSMGLDQRQKTASRAQFTHPATWCGLGLYMTYLWSVPIELIKLPLACL